MLNSRLSLDPSLRWPLSNRQLIFSKTFSSFSFSSEKMMSLSENHCRSLTYSPFHQHFTSSVCAGRSQRRKKTQMTLLSFLGSVLVKAACKHVGEIEGGRACWHDEWMKLPFMWFLTYLWAWMITSWNACILIIYLHWQCVGEKGHDSKEAVISLKWTEVVLLWVSIFKIF